MNLEQVRYFLAIAETGNFTQAAERLFVSQPSLSSGIKKLEQELGVTLFERGGRRTQLTPAGQLFLEKAQKILQEYELALYQLRDFQKRPTLRLGILCTLSIASISGLISAFRKQYPEVTLELRDSHVDNLSCWLANREIDLAVTALEDSEDPQTSLKLFDQRLLLAVPSAHPFAQRKTINLSELDDQPYIERVNCEFWRASPQMYESAGVEPHIIYRADSEEWVISLIQAGWGMSVMPEWQNLTGIVYLCVSEINLNRTVGLKWRKQNNLEVVNLFRSVAAKYDWQLALTGCNEYPILLES